LYFPGADVEINPFVPPLLMFVISFFTSMGGVSGAFLLLPLQSMFWHLAVIIIVGTLPGVFVGAVVRIKYLLEPDKFKIFVGFVLLYIGVRLILDLIKTRDGKNKSSEDRFYSHVKSNSDKARPKVKNLSKIRVKKFNTSTLIYEFCGESFIINVPIVCFVSLFIGIVGGIYGIGGGAIMAPFLVAIFKLPVYTIAGAALMGTFVTSVSAVLFFHLLASFYPDLQLTPDWMLGFLFGLGGFGGIYCGAFFQKYFPAKFIKAIISLCVFFISIKYIIGIFL